MHEKQIATTILLGCALIAFGLIPGLLSGIKEGIQNFHAQWFGVPTIFPRHSAYPKWLPGQIWFACAGFALILIALVELITR